MIDFGRAAEGWVDSRFKNSKEGDLQGFDRVMKHIERMEMHSD